MLLALIICHLSIFAAANPFHKYPFVFLLDVGNEELEKTNSEQIRVSVPGGSVALRYPAIGDGNLISHVRVSGIDFGTDLKANIVDGGPGYKYVVLVFIGNRGVPYDAVVTVQSITDSTFTNSQNLGPIVNNAESIPQTEEDENNSAEDLSDDTVSNTQSEISVQNRNAELMQSSVNVYNYVEKESIDENDDINEDSEGAADSDQNSDKAINADSDDNDDEYNEVSNEKYEDTPYSDDQQDSKANIEVKGIETEDNDADDDDDDEEINSSVEKSDFDSEAEPIIVDSNLYSKYKALRDHLNFGRQVYSQEDLQKSNIPVYQEDPMDYEEIDSAGPVYDDEELNDRAEKFRDSNNNNYMESDDSYAVAY